MEPFLKPMLAQQGKQFPQIRSGPVDWYLEPKYDGWRAIVHKDEHGQLHLYGGRNSADYTGQLPYIEQELDYLLPDGTAIDGELIAEDGWGSVQSTMTSGSPPQGRPVNFVVFDLLRLSLRDVRSFAYEKRTEALTVLEWDACPSLEMVEAFHADPAKHIQLVDEGYEGSVWKRAGSAYHGIRSGMWLKFKHERTDEAIVTGFKPGQGEFAGMIGAIEFELCHSGVASRCSGMDMTTRQEMTANQAAWIGSVIEVKHNGIMKSGAPRHPQYLRRRDDRDPAEARAASIAPLTPAPRPAPRPRQTSAGVRAGDYPGASKRNYGAMTREKLLRSIRELEAGYGEAVEKARGADLSQDHRKAEDIARAKGWL